MKFQHLITLFAATTLAIPLGRNISNAKDKRDYETQGAAKWPSLPTIAERDEKRNYEIQGAAKWPSLPTIAEKA
ncbi:hypothetical protein TruAng_002854 [Truncatella angustata]|nr:hypothetical protein TruAng_002854 [Truncatella angustata]